MTCKPLAATAAAAALDAVKSCLNPAKWVQAIRPCSNDCMAVPTAAAEAFSLERVTIRLDGLDSYGVVTALLVAATLSMMSSVHFGPNDNLVDAIAKLLLTVFVSATVIGGSHATVVYTLTNIYSKTAIGMGKDEAFVIFMARTTRLRTNAFDAFLISLASFNVSFVLFLFVSFHGKLRWYITGSVALFSLYMFLVWREMIQIASDEIFS